MTQNISRLQQLWNVLQEQFKSIKTVIEIVPWLRSYKVGLPIVAFVFVLVTVVSNRDTLLSISIINKYVQKIGERSLPLPSADRFSVAVGHIEGDKGGEVETLIVESLKKIPGVEPIRFDRRSEILAADQPAEAERRATMNARAWLNQSGADVLLFGYLLPTTDRLVRILLIPRLTDDSFEAKFSAANAIEFPLYAREQFQDVIRVQILAYAGQFDPSRASSGELQSAVSKLEKLVDTLPPGRRRVDIQVALGNVLAEYGTHSMDTEALRTSAKAYREALRAYSKHDDLPRRLEIQNYLGSVLRRLGQSDVNRLEEAIVVYKDALSHTSPKAEPLGWGALQNNMGIALHLLGKYRADEPLLRQAVAAQRISLRYPARELDSTEWALRQNSLGNTLVTLGALKQDPQLIVEAIEAYRVALEEEPKDTAPMYWAMTQNNLGIALFEVAQLHKSTKELAMSQAALDMAATIYTRDRSPERWATTTHNLALIQLIQSYIEHDVGHLKKAVALCNLVLEERSRTRFPVQWAETQTLLGEVFSAFVELEKDRKYLGEASRAFNAAAEVYTKKDFPHQFLVIQHELNKLKTM